MWRLCDPQPEENLTTEEKEAWGLKLKVPGGNLSIL